MRPLIRFVTARGDTITQPMNGAVLGSAQWIGRIPDNIVSAAISPVQRAGPFAFRLDRLRPIRRATLARQGLRQNPDWLYWAARSRLLNYREEAWQALGSRPAARRWKVTRNGGHSSPGRSILMGSIVRAAIGVPVRCFGSSLISRATMRRSCARRSDPCAGKSIRAGRSAPSRTKPRRRFCSQRSAGRLRAIRAFPRPSSVTNRRSQIRQCLMEATLSR